MPEYSPERGAPREVLKGPPRQKVPPHKWTSGPLETFKTHQNLKPIETPDFEKSLLAAAFEKGEEGVPLRACSPVLKTKKVLSSRLFYTPLDPLF